jgi:tetratricopeptide (TPR) repeat protein
LTPLLLVAAVATAAPAQPPRTSPLITGSAARQTCPDLVTPDALVCRALQAEKNGDDAAAAQGFEEAAKAAGDKDPRTARMYAAAGNLWIAANQPAKAAADLDKGLVLNGLEGVQRGQALLDRARAAEAQDDLVTARTKLNAAKETISDDPFYWYFSAALALRERDGATAQTAIAKALSLAPGDPAVLFEAGHVADFNGNEDQARSYWTRAAASDPNGPVGKAAAKAVEMLGVTPVVKTDAPAPKPGQPKS